VYKQYSRRKNSFHKNGLIKAKYVSTNNQAELSRQHKSANCKVSSTLPPAFYPTKVNDITLQCSFGLFHPCYSPWLIPIVPYCSPCNIFVLCTWSTSLRPSSLRETKQI